jgi:hypothetical protein
MLHIINAGFGRAIVDSFWKFYLVALCCGHTDYNVAKKIVFE